VVDNRSARHTGDTIMKNTIRKTIAALALLVTVGGTTQMIGAPSASAATAVTFCFNYANPPTHTIYANRPVYVGWWSGNTWTMRQGTSNSAGCGTFWNLPATQTTYVLAETATAFQTWSSGWIGFQPGNYMGNTGTRPVFRTR